jgi:hypothetical protein
VFLRGKGLPKEGTGLVDTTDLQVVRAKHAADHVVARIRSKLCNQEGFLGPPIANTIGGCPGQCPPPRPDGDGDAHEDNAWDVEVAQGMEHSAKSCSSHDGDPNRRQVGEAITGGGLGSDGDGHESESEPKPAPGESVGARRGAPARQGDEKDGCRKRGEDHKPRDEEGWWLVRLKSFQAKRNDKTW